MNTSSAALPAWRISALLAALAALVGALWYFAFDAYRQGEIAQLRRELAAITEVKMQRIHGWLEERRSDAAVLGELTFVRDALEAAPGSPRLADDRRQLELYLRNYNYQALLLFDRAARLRLAVGAADSDVVAAVAADNGGFTNGGGSRIASLRLPKTGGDTRLLLQFVAPVRAGDGRAGTVVLLVDSLAAIDTLAAVNRGRIGSREVGIIERRGEELRVLNTPLYARPAELSIEAGNPLRPAAMAAQGRSGPLEGQDYRGVAVMAHVGRIPGIDWLIVTKQDRADFFAPINRVALWSGTLALLLLLASGIALTGWRRIRQNELALARGDAAQQALRASEARFRKLNEHATDISLLFDSAMVVRYATPSAEGFIGRAAEGEPIASGTARVHPDDVARVEAARQAALERPGVPQDVRHRLLHVSDGWRVMEATFTNLFDDPDVCGLSYEARDISERTQAEETLQHERDLLQTLIDCASHSHLAYLDRDFLFVHVNAAYAATCGYRPEEMVGRNHFELYPNAENEAIFARVRDTGEPFEARDKPFAFPDQPERGTTYWDWTLIPVKDAAGRVEGLVFSLFETTAHKRTEQALRDSEERYRFLFDSSPLPMWVFDMDSLAFLEVNGTAIAQYGYSRKEFLAMTLHDIRPPEDVAELVRMIGTDVREQGRIWTHRRKDGSLLKAAIWFQDVHFLGRPARMILAENVTARIEAEEALVESEARLRAIFDSAPVGIAIADAGGRYLIVNRAQCEMLGYSEAELLQRTYADITHPVDVSANLDLNKRMQSGEISVGSMEKRYVHKDGHVFWVLLTIGLVRTAGGEVIGSVGVAQDITERREAEARRLEYARQQRDTLVREVHHRIKNHLQGLAGLLRQHLHERPALAPVLQQFAAQITAIAVIHGLQGRTANGQVSLRGLVTEVAAFLGGITGVPLRLAGDAGQCFMAATCMQADACKWQVAEEESVPLALILNELLTNALRHGSDKARIRVSMECEPSGARVLIRHPGRLDAGLDFAGGKGLGTGLNLIRSLLPQAGAALSLEDAEEGWVETRLELGPPVLRLEAAAQVDSRR